MISECEHHMRPMTIMHLAECAREPATADRARGCHIVMCRRVGSTAVGKCSRVLPHTPIMCAQRFMPPHEGMKSAPMITCRLGYMI